VAFLATQRATGTVKFFDTEKGFGFIGRRHGEDVFVHISEVQRSGLTKLFEGQQVDFDVKDTPKGPQAENLEAHEFVPQLPPDLRQAAVEPSSLAHAFYAAALWVFEAEEIDPAECRLWDGRALTELDPGFRINVDSPIAAGPSDEECYTHRREALETMGRVAGLRLARDDILKFYAGQRNGE
jgi:CspA family cold shock protein